MIEKTSCQQCGVHIEFDIENANQFVPCPSCGQQTRLSLPVQKSVKTLTSKRKKSWIALALIIALVIGFVFLCIYAGTSGNEKIAGALGTIAGVVIMVMIGSLLYVFVSSGLFVATIIFAMIIGGLYFCLDGFFLKQSVEASQNGTIYQQIYATVEMVGGALVFCGAMILWEVRKISKAKNE